MNFTFTIIVRIICGENFEKNEQKLQGPEKGSGVQLALSWMLLAQPIK